MKWHRVVVPAQAVRELADVSCVVSCDTIITIDKSTLGRHVGFLLERQEHELAAAIVSAFALRTDEFS